MARTLYKPLLRPLADLSPAAAPLAQGSLGFDRLLVLEGGRRDVVPLHDVPTGVLDRLTAPRDAVPGLQVDRCRIMGILNVTPDSFSDGGKFLGQDAAQAQLAHMVQAGADILDIGGESTRPGADFVTIKDEIARTVPVISAIAGQTQIPLSIDTRKADVGRAALATGASWLNDVSGGEFDPQMIPLAAETGAPICLMHSKGDPKTMQQRASYQDVLAEVYDYLDQRLTVAEQAGISRGRVIVDPGIGFGKTLDHNLALLRDIAVFHGLGCPILVGASRKRFIGTLTGVEDAHCLLYTSPSPRDGATSRMPSSA